MRTISRPPIPVTAPIRARGPPLPTRKTHFPVRTSPASSRTTHASRASHAFHLICAPAAPLNPLSTRSCAEERGTDPGVVAGSAKDRKSVV